MKSNILNGLMLITALSVASCSTQKMASTEKIDDDVYYTKAKAGDMPDAPLPTFRQDVYAGNTNAQQNDPQSNDPQYYDSYGNDDGDYYYYDSYASRINRFGYASPFGFYDDYYYGYSPYTAYGYGGGLGYGYSGFGLGLGYGYGGYGYGGLGFGYGGYYGYSPFGIGYGGGYPYWGVYSAYGYGGYGYGGIGGGYGYGLAANRARPFRGSGAPGSNMTSRAVRGIGYNGNYPGVNSYPGRPITNSYGGRNRTNGYPSSGSGNYSNGRATRGVRTDYPNYQQPARTTNSFPGNDGGGRSSGGGSAPSGGGGGGRPVRP